MARMEVLLVTNRATIHVAYASVGERSVPPWSVTRVAPTPEALAQHAGDAMAADVAVVDADEPQAAIEACEQLGQRRPTLPVLALLCCPACQADLDRLWADAPRVPFEEPRVAAGER